VARDTISKAERGEHAPNAATLHKIAGALGVTPSELLAEEEKLAPKARGPLPPQRSLWNHLAEEQRAAATFAELERVGSYVTDKIERWEGIAHGESFPYVNIDHGFASEVWLDVAGLSGWLGSIRRRAEAELPPDEAASVRQEIVALVDRLERVADEIKALADAAAGITAETAQDEALRLMDERAQAMRRVRMQPGHADQLAEKLRRREEEGRKRVAEAKGQVVGE
jgi:transcriptional regulator with XRE-family HTH domain